LFGFRLEHIGEIIRMPNLACMPLAPRSLLGLANLRGVVLPVVSLRRLLGLPDPPFDEATRVIVIDCDAPIRLIVDRIKTLASVPIERIDNDDAEAGSTNRDFLGGLVKGAEGGETIRILDARPAKGVSIWAPEIEAEQQQQVSLVSFDLGQPEYALPLEGVTRRFVQNCTLSQTDAVGGDDA
jgi:purine-binding chemotaxis protein CheW